VDEGGEGVWGAGLFRSAEWSFCLFTEREWNGGMLEEWNDGIVE